MGYSVFPAPASGITQADLITVPNWEQIGYSNTPNTTTITFSSISSQYKKLKIVAKGLYNSFNGNYPVYIRFNSDSGSNYASIRRYQYDGGSIPLNIEYFNNVNSSIVAPGLTVSNAYGTSRRGNLVLEIDNTSSGTKVFSGWHSYQTDINNFYYEHFGQWKTSTNTTISSITFTNGGNNFAVADGADGIYIFGAK